MAESFESLITYAAWCLAEFGPQVDALTVAENAARPLTQEELDTVFDYLDAYANDDA